MIQALLSFFGATGVSQDYIKQTYKAVSIAFKDVSAMMFHYNCSSVAGFYSFSPIRKKPKINQLSSLQAAFGTNMENKKKNVRFCPMFQTSD